MTLLTITEAAKFLRLTKRTMYQRSDIPRVRYGHRIMYVKEDLEKWIRTCCEGPVMNRMDQQEIAYAPVDGAPATVYHRNPVFVSARHK